MNKKKIYKFYIKVFISCIILMIVSYLYKNDLYNNYLNKYMFESNIDYSYFRSKTNKILKNILGKNDSYVISEKMEYYNIEKVNNSYKIITDNNYIIKNLKNGVVTYIGDKDDLGKTIIVQLDDGTYIWYSSIENISVNVYDYINKGTILGSTIKNYIYLTIIKDDEYLSYEEYL